LYKLDKIGTVFHQTFEGLVSEQEMANWVSDSEKALLKDRGQKFHVYADLRNLKPLSPQARDIMVKGQEMYKKSGLNRSVVVLQDSITTMQFKRIARDSGIDSYERYIDASTVRDFEKIGMDWLLYAKDPDKVSSAT
jgi:hypothetical protein